MNRLYMLVGLPRSGKTTWAVRSNYPVVCPDAIRISLHGSVFRKEAEPMVWAIAKIMVASLFEAGNMDVILDACNVSCKRREEWVDERWKRRFVVMPYTPQKSKERAVESGKNYLLDVINRMSGEYEVPRVEELYSWELLENYVGEPFTIDSIS